MFMLIRMMLGELDAVAELVDRQFYIANIYFILFAIVVTIILLNLLIGIVSEYFAIEHARNELMEKESRRRGYQLPQFEYPMFGLLFSSWWAIISDTDVPLSLRVRGLLLTICGLTPAICGRELASDAMSYRAQKIQQRKRSMAAALKLAEWIGMDLTEVIKGYLEVSLSQELTDQVDFTLWYTSSLAPLPLI